MAELGTTGPRDYGVSARTCVQVGHRAGTDALVGVMGGLELDLLVPSDLGHVMYISTPVLMLLGAGHDRELLGGKHGSRRLLCV